MSEKLTQLPDGRGHFGRFGGRYVPETLIPALDELADMDSWNRLTGTDGAGMHLTYGTACHELRRWTQAAGPEGPRNVVSALRNHEPFAAAYRRIEAQSDPLPVFAAHDGQAWTSANAADGGLTPQTIRASVTRP